MNTDVNPDFTKTSLLDFMKLSLYSTSPAETQLAVSLRYLDDATWPHTPDTESLFFGRGVFVISEAAKQGNVDAQYALGQVNWYGRTGGYPDLEEAVRWFRKAAEQGHPEAQKSLADAYRWKLGIPRSELQGRPVTQPFKPDLV